MSHNNWNSHKSIKDLPKINNTCIKKRWTGKNVIMEIISQKQKQNQKIEIRPLSEEQNPVTPCLRRLHREGTPVGWTSCVLLSPGLTWESSSKTLARERGPQQSVKQWFLRYWGWKLNLNWICLEIKYFASIVDIIIWGKICQELWEISIHGILEIKNRKKYEKVPFKRMLLFKHFRKGLLTLLCRRSEQIHTDVSGLIINAIV